jgi:aryl-alcohol dehydrogenase-like predicted oxidoreductase
VEVLQILYNRLDRRAEEAAFPSAQKQNLGVFARVPLASGLLTGKYKPGAKFPPGDARHEQKPEEIERKLREVERIAKEEVPSGVPMAQWALAWCLKHPAVTAVIPGCKDVKQVESNAKTADLVP